MNKFAVDSEQVFKQFMLAREKINTDTPVLCFSDVFRTGLLDGEFDSTRLCQRYINLIREVFDDCTLLSVISASKRTSCMAPACANKL